MPFKCKVEMQMKYKETFYPKKKYLSNKPKVIFSSYFLGLLSDTENILSVWENVLSVAIVI